MSVHRITRHIQVKSIRGRCVRLDGNKKYTYVIEWSEKHTAFLARCIQTKTGLANLTPFKDIEVIGNIYDNPTLLKVGADAIYYCNKHIYATGKGYK